MEISVAVAFLAGLVSFASPCCLPMVPIYVGYMVGATPAESPSARAVAVKQALAFVAGFTLVFVSLWASIGLIGYVLRDQVVLLRQLGGVILVVMGLHVSGLVRIPMLHREFRMSPRRVLVGPNGATATPRTPNLGRSTLFGMVFAAGWTPCIGPILGGIIGLASLNSSVAEGALLLVVYALGLGVPFIAVAMGIATASRHFAWFRRHQRGIDLATGLMLVVVGFLMISNLLVKLPAFVPQFGL